MFTQYNVLVSILFVVVCCGNDEIFLALNNYFKRLLYTWSKLKLKKNLGQKIPQFIKMSITCRKINSDKNIAIVLGVSFMVVRHILSVFTLHFCHRLVSVAKKKGFIITKDVLKNPWNSTSEVVSRVIDFHQYCLWDLCYCWEDILVTKCSKLVNASNS